MFRRATNEGKMALHKRFWNIPIGQCDCKQAESFDWYIVRDMALKARYETEKVEIVCPACDGVASMFYRKPGLEKEPTKADKALIGETVKVKRFVAWVGYAKNTSTVFWSHDDERAKMIEVLAETALMSLEDAADAIGVNRNGNGWLESAAQKHARYLLFEKAFTDRPWLPARGLWFMDAERILTISGILSCQTGSYCSGSSGDSWYDDYEPPDLYGRTYHQLYYGYSDDFQPALIYPGDCFAAQQEVKEQ